MKLEGLRTFVEYDNCGGRFTLRDEVFRAKLVALAAAAGESLSASRSCRGSDRRDTYFSDRGVLLLFLESHGYKRSPETKKKARIDVL